jgi:hypothetical protein
VEKERDADETEADARSDERGERGGREDREHGE